jgi:predicted transposase/invertase (TIGR01784 family)
MLSIRLRHDSLLIINDSLQPNRLKFPMTNRELTHPHDLLVRRFLAEPELMANLMTFYVKQINDQKIIQLIDLAHLRCESPININEDLVESIGDLRFSTNFKSSQRHSTVFLLFEHQSTIDKHFRVRGLDYIVKTYKKFKEKTKGKAKYPYPIVVVLYHGTILWKKLLEMDDMIEMVPGTERHLLRYKLILIDVSHIPVNELQGHPALQALIETLQLSSEGQLATKFEHVAERFTAIKHDPRAKNWLYSLVRYGLAVSKMSQELVTKAFSKILNEKEAERMATSTMQELITQGKREGIQEGKREGIQEGKREGIQEGKTEFGRNAILNVLRRRFTKVPQSIETVIQKMNDPIALESLFSHALDCLTLDEFVAALK